MLVVAIGTMALIIVLSVFNGLEGLLRELYGTVDPNLIVTAKVGKSFEYTDELKSSLLDETGIDGITEVLEDNVLIRYNKAQRVARVKGVSEDFISQGRLEDYIVYGENKLYDNEVPYAILGRGVQYDLSVNPSNDFYTLQMYFPEDIGPAVVNPDRMYKVKHILPGSVFAVEKYYDENYVYVPIKFAESLFDKPGKRSALEIQLDTDYSTDDVKTRLNTILGNAFLVQSNEEIHGGLYKILKYEKFFVFLTFSVIIAIASINIFFSLTMLAIDKKKDIAILAAQGASSHLIRNIFLLEGCIVAFTGAFTGLILGLLISYLQQQFGIISMGVQSAIIDAYPVKIEWVDVLMTALCIVIITIITAIQPAIKASRNIEVKALQ
jgi:lipoprotein-releasing system permease protein